MDEWINEWINSLYISQTAISPVFPSGSQTSTKLTKRWSRGEQPFIEQDLAQESLRKDLQYLFQHLTLGDKLMAELPVHISPLNAGTHAFLSFKEIHLLEPMSYCHHHVEWSQEENEVEVGITVHRAFLLIINHSLASPFFNMLVSISCKIQKTRKFCKFIENWK